MRVLLVDDEGELVSTLAERLSFRGIDADWVTSGPAAIDLAHQVNYDLAVLDVKMPKMGGLELMERLKADHPDMKFIFLTGHGSKDDCVAGTEAGACHYLMKPIKFEALLDKIQTAMLSPAKPGNPG